MKIAIIPARGGSKRIPHKNIRKFCGKPIIAYSIQTCLESNCFDEVMVSTDDDEIIAISKEYGASVPFKRSAKTATDYAITADVLFEVLLEFQKREIKPDLACCIYPTAALITPQNLIKALKIIENNNLLSVMSVVRYSHPTQRALYLKDNFISFINPEFSVTRSQDLEPTYHDAGQFYWFKVKEFLTDPVLITSNTGGLILPESHVQDIDNEEDWLLAEIKYKFLKQSNLNKTLCPEE